MGILQGAWRGKWRAIKAPSRILFPAFLQLPLGKLINISKPQLSHQLNWDNNNFYFRGVDETMKWNILCKAFKIVPKGQYSDSDEYLATLVRDEESLGKKLPCCSLPKSLALSEKKT